MAGGARRLTQALEAGGARRLRNESFFSAPQLERDPLGRRSTLRDINAGIEAGTNIDEEEARRREIAPALARLTGASHAKDIVLDLYSIGGRPALEAVSHAIGESPLGRAYLSIHIQAVQRREAGAVFLWRDRLRSWLARERRTGLTKIVLHSGSMTSIRFMLVEEGFAKLVRGAVTIDPTFIDAMRLALEGTSASSNKVSE